MSRFSFSVPTLVRYGEGVAQEIGAEITSYVKKQDLKAMIVTDKGILGAGLLDGMTNSLAQSGIAYVVFDAVEPNPRDTTVQTAAQQYKDEGANMLIAVGGGSVLDAAKAIGVVATYGGEIADYDGFDLVPGPIAPLFAVPTTAGTGSEVTIWAVITDTKNKVKMGIGDYKICPAVALVDPVMTYSLPRALTVGTGMDALTHAIESYTCKAANPACDALALKAIGLIAKHLPQAAAVGFDAVARDGMMLGSLLAGMAFSNTDVAAVHCLAESVGATVDGPHGMLNAIFLPYVMAYNLQEVPDLLANIAVSMGEDARPEAAIEAVVKMQQILNVSNLREFGVREEDAKMLGEMSEAHPSTADNARTITAEDYTRIIKMAVAGEPAL